MNNVIDNHFMQHLEYKQSQEFRFVRVDSDTTDRLINADAEMASVLSENEIEKVKGLFTSVLGENQSNKLETKALSPEDHPIVITTPEFMRRMAEMQAMQGGAMADGMNDFYNIVINTNHGSMPTTRRFRTHSNASTGSVADRVPGILDKIQKQLAQCVSIAFDRG